MGSRSKLRGPFVVATRTTQPSSCRDSAKGDHSLFRGESDIRWRLDGEGDRRLRKTRAEVRVGIYQFGKHHGAGDGERQFGYEYCRKQRGGERDLAWCAVGGGGKHYESAGDEFVRAAGNYQARAAAGQNSGDHAARIVDSFLDLVCAREARFAR